MRNRHNPVLGYSIIHGPAKCIDPPKKTVLFFPLSQYILILSPYPRCPIPLAGDPCAAGMGGADGKMMNFMTWKT